MTLYLTHCQSTDFSVLWGVLSFMELNHVEKGLFASVLGRGRVGTRQLQPLEAFAPISLIIL